MGYFDGNTVMGLWNYAQYFSLSDNFYGSTFGPSTVGALNLAAGQTHGASPTTLPRPAMSSAAQSSAIRNLFTMIARIVIKSA
jgi:phospholipase C